ncbi:MAG: hypothetical protein ACI4OA_05935 [Selenomonadaceae bacterium]
MSKAFHSHIPELEDEPPKKRDRLFTHPQKASMMLAVFLLIYALVAWDLPLFFLLVSFLMFMLRPLVAKYLSESLANVMKGFSVSVGIGSFIMMFL